MTKTHAAIAVAALVSTAAASLAQTSTTATKPAVHRSTTTTTGSRAAANPADNPPNVPRVAGTPKPLYALRYIDTVIGTGALAQPQMFYTVRYTGWLTDGTKFDSSDDHPGKEPITFPYGAHRVIPGWDTGFEGMRIGGKRRLYIPYELAYGESGRPPVIPAKANLIFDIELVAVSDKQPTPPAPAADPAKPAEPANPPQPSTQPADPTKPTTAPPAGTNPSAAPTSK